MTIGRPRYVRDFTSRQLAIATRALAQTDARLDMCVRMANKRHLCRRHTGIANATTLMKRQLLVRAAATRLAQNHQAAVLAHEAACKQKMTPPLYVPTTS